MGRASRDEVRLLWARRRGPAFPDVLRGVGIGGESVAGPDAMAAGRIAGYLGGRVESWQRAVPRDRADSLRAVLPGLRDPDGHSYVLRLVQMANLVLTEPSEFPGGAGG